MATTQPAAAPRARGAWRRWLVIVLAFNIALGMGFSVVLLRHQVDDQARAAELFAQLDAAVSQDEAARYAAPGAPADLGAPAALADLVGAGGTEDDDLRAVRASVGAFVDTAGSGDTAALAAAADAARAAVATALTAHRADTSDLGRVADFETVFMMVFAAGTAGLLFRRFEAARRTGELRVVAAKARSEARFRALVHSSSDVITLAGPDLSVRFQTPSAERVLGWTAEELAGTSLVDLVHPEDRLTLLDAHAGAVAGTGADVVSEVRVRDRDGAWRHVRSVHTNLLADPSVAAVVVTTRDVTAQKRLEHQLQHNAFHDALTGLANRALFSDRLDHALARSDRAAASLAVLFVDLDDFKSVNDSAGHAAGDELLVAVAGRLRDQLRPGDTIARLGGDEFAVLLEDTDSAAATVAADRLQAALVGVGPDGAAVAASIGIAVGAAGQHDAAELLRSADVAMYAAKQAGKGRSAVFEPDMDAAIVGQLQLKAELTRALADSEFVVHYQPTVELTTGRMAGVEALVRWQHPDRGLVPPGDFVPLAEQSGLVVPLGRYVLTEACRQMRAWHDRHPGARHLTVAVNLSARELEEPGLVDAVRTALRVTGLDPARLTLEITETLLLVDLPRTVAVLTELRALGLRLAIDDFGTGYSSLAYLEQLPVQVLKIDKSFVDRIAEPAGADDGRPTSVMVAAISQLGHTLHLEMVAEGVEHAEQAVALRVLGCQYGQGYVFSRPLPPGALEELVQAGTGWADLVVAPAVAVREPAVSG